LIERRAVLIGASSVAPSHTITPVADDDLVQVAERALADAEEAFRLDPSEANQRRVMSAWSFVRHARERADHNRQSPPTAPDE
jgi:hypothetical protein